MMSIRDVKNAITGISEENLDLPFYVCDLNTGNNTPIVSVSLFDVYAEHSEENMLAVNFEESVSLCENTEEVTSELFSLILETAGIVGPAFTDWEKYVDLSGTEDMTEKIEIKGYEGRETMSRHQFDFIDGLIRTGYLKLKDGTDDVYVSGSSNVNKFLVQVSNIFIESTGLVMEGENDYYETACRLYELCLKHYDLTKYSIVNVELYEKLQKKAKANNKEINKLRSSGYHELSVTCSSTFLETLDVLVEHELLTTFEVKKLQEITLKQNEQTGGI